METAPAILGILATIFVLYLALLPILIHSNLREILKEMKKLNAK
jgi:hypothetical protein